MSHILVVDDDPTVREVVASYLRAAGHDVVAVADGASAIASVGTRRPDLLVLDLMLPDLNGLQVCARIRAICQVPVVMLTALGQEPDRVAGLQVGADDYVTKPFSPRELALRVDSVLRRTRQAVPAEPVLRDGDLVVDWSRRRATRDGHELSLTPRELDLLWFLVAHRGVAFNREELLDRVWGWSFGDRSTVTVHVRRLREKVEPDPRHPTRLLTVWGIGYRWEPSA